VHRDFIASSPPLIGRVHYDGPHTFPDLEALVPRAKRTTRAEARRRYRASQNMPLEDSDELEAEEGSADAKPTPSRRTTAATSSTDAQPRPSIARAFRAAFTPVDIAGDLRALPRLLIDKAFWIPAGAIVALTGVVLVTGGKELVSQLLSPYFLYPPPIAPVFLAGFLAPRGSWLLGGLIGVVQSIATLVIVLTSPALGAATSGDSGVFAYSLFVSIAFGSFYAAAAAWYKRFLRGAQPPRRAAAPAGKSSGGQKRSESRPLLARRR
jgi:hypothetical protein